MSQHLLSQWFIGLGGDRHREGHDQNGMAPAGENPIMPTPNQVSFSSPGAVFCFQLLFGHLFHFQPHTFPLSKHGCFSAKPGDLPFTPLIWPPLCTIMLLGQIQFCRQITCGICSRWELGICCAYRLLPLLCSVLPKSWSLNHGGVIPPQSLYFVKFYHVQMSCTFAILA